MLLFLCETTGDCDLSFISSKLISKSSAYTTWSVIDIKVSHLSTHSHCFGSTVIYIHHISPHLSENSTVYWTIIAVGWLSNTVLKRFTIIIIWRDQPCYRFCCDPRTRPVILRIINALNWMAIHASVMAVVISLYLLF